MTDKPAEMTVRLGAVEKALLETGRKTGRLPLAVHGYIRDEKAAVGKMVEKKLLSNVGSVLFLIESGQTRADAEHLKVAAAKAPSP